MISSVRRLDLSFVLRCSHPALFAFKCSYIHALFNDGVGVHSAQAFSFDFQVVLVDQVKHFLKDTAPGKIRGEEVMYLSVISFNSNYYSTLCSLLAPTVV